MTKKKRRNKLAKVLRKEHRFSFADAFRLARLFISGRFLSEAHEWFRIEEEWGTFCARGCCRGATGRSLFIRRKADGKDMVWTTADVERFEAWGMKR